MVTCYIKIIIIIVMTEQIYNFRLNFHVASPQTSMILQTFVTFSNEGIYQCIVYTFIGFAQSATTVQVLGKANTTQIQYIVM